MRQHEEYHVLRRDRATQRLGNTNQWGCGVAVLWKKLSRTLSARKSEDFKGIIISPGQSGDTIFMKEHVTCTYMRVEKHVTSVLITCYKSSLATPLSSHVH